MEGTDHEMRATKQEAIMNHPQPHDLTALAYALVPSPEREQLLEHIAACDACREAYDAAFEEQALVRDVMFEEVRSGEAEARALEKVLLALKNGAAVAEEKRGKVLGLFSPWGIALQMAATVAIAAGIFYVAVVMPNNEAPVTPSSDSGSVAKDEIPVKGGDVMVLADGAPELDSGRWSSASAVPVGVWCRNDNKAPLTFSIDGADLQFEPGAYFQLQPSNGDLSVYVLRGDASMSNATRMLNVITNTNEFRALPGSTFEVECQFAFLPSQRGKEVPAPNGQSLVQAEVKKGEVIFVPSGETWESPRGGVLRVGRKLDVQSTGVQAQGVNVRLSRQLRAMGAEFDGKMLDEALGKLKEYDPKGHAELRIRLQQMEQRFEDMNEAEVVLKVVLENKLELTQRNNEVEIKDPKRALSLTIDKDNYVVAEVTINGETKTCKAASLDELAQKCPAIADLLGSVTIETPSEGKRRISLKRSFYEQQELQEEKQQKQEQRVK